MVAVVLEMTVEGAFCLDAGAEVGVGVGWSVPDEVPGSRWSHEGCSPADGFDDNRGVEEDMGLESPSCGAAVTALSGEFRVRPGMMGPISSRRRDEVEVGAEEWTIVDEKVLVPSVEGFLVEVGEETSELMSGEGPSCVRGGTSEVFV
jgi:hypothetical protein